MESVPVRRRRGRIVLWAGAGVLLVAAAVVGVIATRSDGRGSPEKKKNGGKDPLPPAPVELTAVARGDISTWLRTTAVLEAWNEAAIAARREGQVVALMVEEGRAVVEGTPLARLDDAEARLAVERAEVGVEAARREAERGRQLKERGYISAREWDDLDLKLRQAAVDLDQARHDLSQCVIRAPFAGRVAERLVDVGQTVAAGHECFRMVDPDPLRVRLYFPERELPHVRVGQEAVLALDAQPNREFRARVAVVNPVVDRGNGTFRVTLELSNAGGELRPGSFARVRLETGNFRDAVLVPRRGVLSEDGESYAFVASGDSVLRRPVTLGAVEESVAQVLGGLVVGERVVTAGHGGLKQGTRIKAVRL